MTERGEERPITVEFDLTPEEWVDVAVEHNLGSEVFRTAVRKSQAAFAAIIVLLGLLGFMAGYPGLTLVWIFAGAVGAVLLPRRFESTQRRQYADIAARGITNGMFGTHRVHLLESGLVDETEAYQRLTRWHAIERVVDGPGAFMIYFGSDAFLPVPHSAFRDSETLRGFSDYFYTHLGRPTAEAPRLETTATQEEEPRDDPEPGSSSDGSRPAHGSG